MQLPALNFESASRAAFKREPLPLALIERGPVETGQPLFGGRLRCRRCLTQNDCRAACEQCRQNKDRFHRMDLQFSIKSSRSKAHISQPAHNVTTLVLRLLFLFFAERFKLRHRGLSFVLLLKSHVSAPELVISF